MFTIDESATRWSTPRAELRGRLADRPLLVVMHGWGADERDLFPIATLLPPELVLAAIRAPQDAGNGGFAWFRMGERPSVPPAEDVAASVAAVLSWLDGVERDLGPAGRVAALGFSQGGAMSLQLVREAPERFAAAVTLSGFVPTPTHPNDAALTARRPPVFWGRGDRDQIIPNYAVDSTDAWLDGHASAVKRVYPGIAHGITTQEMSDVAEFLSLELGL